MTVEISYWLLPSEAHRVVPCAKNTIFNAIRRGRLPAYCMYCANPVTLEELNENHMCPDGYIVGRRWQLENVILHSRDINRFVVGRGRSGSHADRS